VESDVGVGDKGDVGAVGAIGIAVFVVSGLVFGVATGAF